MSHSVRTFPGVPLVAALLLSLSACHRDGHDDHDHDHGDEAHVHEEREHALANLGERYLAHLIRPDLVRGASASVLFHGTRLDQGSPITGGAVEVIARGPDGTELRFALRESSPGAWPGEIVLPTAGEWRLAVAIDSAAGSERVELGTVVAHADEKTAAHTPVADVDAIDLLIERQWEVAMRFERVEPRALTEWITTSGRIDVRPGGEAHVVVPAAGRLDAPEGGRLPRPGDRVAAGDVLGVVELHLGTSDLVGLQALEYQQHQLRHELDLQQLSAERALGSARVHIEAGEREVARAERLVAQTLATQQELDRARADLQLARSEEAAALASLASVHKLRNEHAEDPATKAPRIPLVAPIAGVVADVEAVIGESVEGGARIATILDLSTVWAVAEVPEADAQGVATTAGARFRPLGADDATDTGSAPVHVAPRVDPTTRCLDVAYAVANADARLRAGMLCTFDLRAGERAQAITVPESALAYEQGRPIAYAMVDGERFEKRLLRLGLRDGDRVEVIEGLRAGDVVVATRADEVRLAALSSSGRIVEHSH